MKVNFVSDLQVVEVNDKVWRLLSPFRALVDSDNGNFLRSITVPQGFETDFASVPRLPFMYWFFGGTAHKAAVLHDYLYSVGGTEEDRLYADQVLKAGMLADGQNSVSAGVMYFAVRQFGKSHFKGENNV